MVKVAVVVVVAIKVAATDKAAMAIAAGTAKIAMVKEVMERAAVMGKRKDNHLTVAHRRIGFINS